MEILNLLIPGQNLYNNEVCSMPDKHKQSFENFEHLKSTFLTNASAIVVWKGCNEDSFTIETIVPIAHCGHLMKKRRNMLRLLA